MSFWQEPLPFSFFFFLFPWLSRSTSVRRSPQLRVRVRRRDTWYLSMRRPTAVWKELVITVYCVIAGAIWLSILALGPAGVCEAFCRLCEGARERRSLANGSRCFSMRSSQFALDCPHSRKDPGPAGQGCPINVALTTSRIRMPMRACRFTIRVRSMLLYEYSYVSTSTNILSTVPIRSYVPARSEGGHMFHCV